MTPDNRSTYQQTRSHTLTNTSGILQNSFVTFQAPPFDFKLGRQSLMDFPLVRFPLWLEECEKLRYFRKITQLETEESQEQVLAQTVRKVLEFIFYQTQFFRK